MFFNAKSGYFFLMLLPIWRIFFSFLLSHGLKTIINLQRPGEHASCGNPLEQESGFTYLPEAFMEAGSKSFHPPLHELPGTALRDFSLLSSQIKKVIEINPHCMVVGLLKHEDGLTLAVKNATILLCYCCWKCKLSFSLRGVLGRDPVETKVTFDQCPH